MGKISGKLLDTYHWLEAAIIRAADFAKVPRGALQRCQMCLFRWF